MHIKAILADCDGTLIELGKINGFHSSIPYVIFEARSKGIAFSIASGRDKYFLAELFTSIAKKPKENEGLIHECSSIYMFNTDKDLMLAGLSEKQISEVEYFMKKNNYLLKGLEKLPNDKSKTCVSWVTQEFAKNQETNFRVLERQFPLIEKALTEELPFVRVKKTRDAIDVEAENVSKALAVQKYSELTGISLSQIAVIGDSTNDMEMFELVGKAGGFTAYVGHREHQKNKVRSYKNHYIPKQKGSAGTVEVIKYILNKLH